MTDLESFKEIWFADFEFYAPNGERPRPLCIVAREWRSSRLIRLWESELLAPQGPPYPIDENSLFVAYYASAALFFSISPGQSRQMALLRCV